MYDSLLYPGVALCAAAAIVLVIKYFSDGNRLPGPWGLPLIGYLPFIGSSPFLTFNKLSKIYGDVFQISVYGRRYVVLNSTEAIKSVLNEGYGRPTEFNYMGSGLNNMGVSVSTGSIWKLHRKFIMSNMFNMSILNEVTPQVTTIGQDLVDYVHSTKGTPHNFCFAFACCSLNAISGLIMSKTFKWDDPQLINLCNAAFNLFKPVAGMKSMLHGPLFQLFEANSMNKSHREFEKIRIEARKVILDILEPRIREFDSGQSSNSDLVAAYLRQHERELATNVPANEQQFTVEFLAYQLLNLFLGGIGTSAEIMNQGTFLLAKHQDVQRNVQKELDEVVGTRLPSLTDRKNMPYTMAVLDEIFRVACIVPLGMTKVTTGEFEVSGRRIPKGSYVYTNFYAASRDEKMFKNAHAFDPNNFLSDSGQYAPNKFSMSFSIGTRNCFGEIFARMELFILFTMLVKNFTFAPQLGTKLEAKVLNTLVRSVEPFEVCAIPRQ